MIDGKYDKFASFFTESDLLDMVDLLAVRYNKLPHQIMTELTVFEFNLNAAIAIKSIMNEAEREEKRPKSPHKKNARTGGRTLNIKVKKAKGGLPEDLIAEMAKNGKGK